MAADHCRRSSDGNLNLNFGANRYLATGIDRRGGGIEICSAQAALPRTIYLRQRPIVPLQSVARSVRSIPGSSSMTNMVLRCNVSAPYESRSIDDSRVERQIGTIVPEDDRRAQLL